VEISWLTKKPARYKPRWLFSRSDFVMPPLDSATGAVSADDDGRNATVEALEQSNSELRQHNRKLLDLEECRSAMIAHVAHELRTPLTSIMGFSEILLSQEDLTAAQRNFCERIQNSAQQLQRSLNQLAELSRMETPPPPASEK
jgi:signal transduction histidine kinase